MQESYSYGLSDGLSPARKGDGLESSYHNNNTHNTHSNNNNIHNDSTSHNNNNNNSNNNNSNNNKGDQHRNNYDEGLAQGPGLGPGQSGLVTGEELGSGQDEIGKNNNNNDNNDNNNDDSMHGDDDEGGIPHDRVVRPQGQGQSHLPGLSPDDDHPNIDMDMAATPEAGEGEGEGGENMMNGEEFDMEDWDDDLRFPDSWSSYVDSPNDSNPPQEGRYKQMK